MYRVKKQIGYFDCELPTKFHEIGVGIIDSGITPHIDLSDCRIYQKNIIKNNIKVYDPYGHGTHVAGIIAGNGINSDKKYAGLAPGVNLYCAKILDQSGNGNLRDLIEALLWLLKINERNQLRIINISIGISNKSSVFSRNYQAKMKEVYRLFEECYKKNIALIISTGNFGPKTGSISSVSDCPNVICVGCHDGEFKIKNKKMCFEYSGAGPGDMNGCNPDIVAPGTDIISCKNDKTGYTKKSGSSMATAIVSGAACLFYAKYPSATVSDFYYKLTHTARKLNCPRQRCGYGMLDLKGLLT